MSPDSSPLASLLAGHTSRAEEEQVLTLLRTATASDFDTVIAETNARTLFSSLDDRLVGPDNRTALRDLLVERVGDLGVPARANVLHGLQAGITGPADNRAIRAVFLATRGAELTELKNTVNMRTDAHDLEGLLFSDLDDDEIRAEILAHIAEQAAGVTPGEAKILCDIDDTVVCALHDRRYPRGTIYPGILALLDALDRGPDDEPFSLGDLTFVTARPGDAFGLIENHTRASLRKAGIATHSVLTGGLRHLLTHDLMAGRKIANIEHYRQLFPEYRLLFIGDSGQGDVRVAELLWEQFEQVVDIVFIHDVVATPDAERARLRGERIELVDTYVGAAVLAFERQLIAQGGVVRVIEEAIAALDKVAWASPEQERSTRALFERDLDAARALGVTWDQSPPPVPDEDVQHTPAPEPEEPDTPESPDLEGADPAT